MSNVEFRLVITFVTKRGVYGGFCPGKTRFRSGPAYLNKVGNP